MIFLEDQVYSIKEQNIYRTIKVRLSWKKIEKTHKMGTREILTFSISL